MANLNTPSYSILQDKEKRVRAIQELYSNHNKIAEVIPSAATSSNQVADKAYVDTADTAITNVIPSDATASNQLADKAWVTSQISGIGGMTISKVFAQASLVAADNTYYALRTSLSLAMTIRLPEVNDNTSEVVHFKVFLTLDTGGSVAYSGNRSSDTIYYTEEYSLAEGNTYEIDVCFNGKAWVIDAKKLVTV